MKKRGLLQEEVVDAVKFPDKAIKKHEKLFCQKDLGRGVIEVVCEKRGKHLKIITLYWL